MDSRIGRRRRPQDFENPIQTRYFFLTLMAHEEVLGESFGGFLSKCAIIKIVEPLANRRLYAVVVTIPITARDTT
jgi:hypothetical protein